MLIGGGGDNSSCWLMIVKTLTNRMELAWHPVVGGLVEGDQGHGAAVGDVRHEPERKTWFGGGMWCGGGSG